MKKLKLNWIPYGSKGLASSRLRIYYPHEYCQSRGVKSTINGPPADYDFVIFQKKGSVTRFKEYVAHSKIIFDFDELGWFTEEEAREFDKIVTVFTTDTEYKQKRYASWMTKPIIKIDEPIDYIGMSSDASIILGPANKVKFIWFGSPGNINDLELLPLDFFDGNDQVKLFLVSAFTSYVSCKNRADKILGGKHIDYELLDWKMETFRGVLEQMDVALIPQTNKSKSVNRIVCCIGHGIPVIFSDIPSHRDLAHAIGIDEYVCDQPGTWLSALYRLCQTEERSKFLIKAQPFINKHYSQSAVGDQWLDLFCRLKK